MIATLHGQIAAVSAGSVVIDVAGVGYRVLTTAEFSGAHHVGDEVRVHTTLVVREDSMTLFGFATVDELDVFEVLLGVNGVGPKSALGVLSVLSPAQIADAVQREDDAPFRKVSGIGPKTAKLITVSLAGRMAAFSARGGAALPAAPVTTSAALDGVLAALVGLGWSERVAAEAVQHVAAEAFDADRASVSTLLRLALAHLGPTQGGGR
ncbi:MAG TPA: Holliday junction branch migration protein RuvA [Candidatus Lumbricidophila sp.]|nr:Holliday junction branch migration protein RuvA [Candidatus Lumbricidophila sp.]